MASKFSSTPQSPTHPTSPPLLQPPWHRPRRSVSSGGRSSSYSNNRATTMRDKFINNVERIRRRVLTTFKKLSLLQQVLAVFALLASAVLGILFLIYNEKIFGWLEPLAEEWKHTTGGWVILWLVTFIVALPPLIGYSTCATTAGFVYGIGEGWLILASATVAGSFCSFLISRTILRKYVERLVAKDKRFAALTLTLKTDGLKLLCMIRLCPLPYSLSNGAMATFPSVHPAMYALATAIITPKLLVHVFIGSRLAAIAKSGEKMSAGTRAVNYVSIVVGMAVGIGTGWYIYQKTMARAKQLEQEEINNIRDSIRRDSASSAQFSDDPEAQAAAATLAEEDEDDLEYFDDEESPAIGKYRDQADGDDIFDQGDGPAVTPLRGLSSPRK